MSDDLESRVEKLERLLRGLGREVALNDLDHTLIEGLLEQRIEDLERKDEKP